VPAHYQDLSYQSDGAADYVDVVIVARLQALMEHGEQPLNPEQWQAVPAFAKVGLEPEVSFVEIEGVAEDRVEVEHILIG